MKEFSLELLYSFQENSPTKGKLLFIQKNYLHLLMATFGILKQIVLTLKQYCDKKLILVVPTLRLVWL